MKQFFQSALGVLSHPSVTDWIVATSTTIYAFFAYRQWHAIRRQANLTREISEANRTAADAARKSADTAYRTLILTHRPKLVIRRVQMDRPDMKQIHVPDNLRDLRKAQAFMGQLVVANNGGTAATIVDKGCWVFLITDALPAGRPYDRYGPNAEISYPQVQGKLLPGDPGVMSFAIPHPGVIEGGRDPLQGHTLQLNLYVMGWVFYEDEIGNRHRTVFCRQWDWSRQVFIPVDNPTYEYEG